MPQNVDNLMEQEVHPTRMQVVTIVGIIAPMRFRGLVDSSGNRRVGAYFFPFLQSPSRTLGFAIRTAQAPETVLSAVRRETAQINPELPFYQVCGPWRTGCQAR